MLGDKKDLEALVNKLDSAQRYTILGCDGLTDEEYDYLKFIVESHGGRWSERCKGFKFDKLDKQTLDSIKSDILVGFVNMSEEKRNRERDAFFPTPVKIVDKMIEIAGLKPDSIMLESSAGTGRILDEARKIINSLDNFVVIELNESRQQVLRNKGYHVDFGGTFEDSLKDPEILKKLKRCDKVVINPPFKNDMDVKHLLISYMVCADKADIVSIMQENSLYYNRSIHRVFKEFLNLIGKDAYEIKSLPAGSFKSEMTTVDTVIIHIKKNVTLQRNALYHLFNYTRTIGITE